MLTSFPEAKSMDQLLADLDRELHEISKAVDEYRDDRNRLLAKIRRALSLLELSISRLSIEGVERATLKELRLIHQGLQL